MLRVLLASLVALAPLGCSDGSGAQVRMVEGRAFDPERVTITAGETVTWTNDSSEPHTVTAYEEDLPAGGTYFASGGASSEEEARERLADGLIEEGGTYEFTFDQPGTYVYFCIPHEGQGMVASIVVEG